MGDKQHRRAVLVQAGDGIVLAGHIQREQRFVGKHHVRVRAKGLGLADQLLLATGKRADEGVSVVNVWAWWCEPCRAELPYLQKVAETHPEWQVVGVHADKNAGNGAAFLNDVGVDLPSFQDADNKFAGQLSLPGVVPVTVVLKDGEVRKQFAQPFSSAAEIERAVKEAIAA